MKRPESQESLKKILLVMVGVFLFYFIPLWLFEGINVALSTASIFVAFFGGFLIIIFFIRMFGHYEKKPKLIRKNKYFEREIPKDYSVAIASLLVSNVFDESIDVPATILSLVGKSVLKYKNKKITAVSNADITNLSEHEKYLYECITERTRIEPLKFQSLVVEDAVNKGYIEKVILKNYTEQIIPVIIIGMFLMVGVPIITALFDGSGEFVSISVIVGFIIIFFSPIYFTVKSDVELGNPYKNTKLGQKELQKLLNLKEYLKEFSDFEKVEIEEAILWEDYIAYAYIFNINKNLYDEFEDIKQITHLFEEAD